MGWQNSGAAHIGLPSSRCGGTPGASPEHEPDHQQYGTGRVPHDVIGDDINPIPNLMKAQHLVVDDAIEDLEPAGSNKEPGPGVDRRILAGPPRISEEEEARDKCD